MSVDNFIIARGILRRELELFLKDNPSTSREYESKLGRVDINIKDVLNVKPSNIILSVKPSKKILNVEEILIFHMKNKQHDIVAFNPSNIEELPIELQKKVKPITKERE